MGTMYQAECPCGYVSAELFVGYGWAGDAYGRELARCAHCQIIVTTPSTSKRPRCPECRRKLEIITLDKERSDDSIILDCPKCGDPGMALHHVGMWD